MGGTCSTRVRNENSYKILDRMGDMVSVAWIHLVQDRNQ
jgi:hypothetical protein